MNNQIKNSKFKVLSEQDLESTTGGFYFTMLAIVATTNVLFGMAVYGSFMDGYYDGKAAGG
jgi:lactobin A/cerein 7B family class IIb bacteriocin